MGIETTHRISRRDAIRTLENHKVSVFESDSSERLEHELYKIKKSDFENYEVVEFEQEEEPLDDKWTFWSYGW